MSIIDLLEQRTLIDTQICIKSGGSFAGLIKMTKGGKPKSGKPKSSRKGKPTCNGDFTKKICAEQKSAVEEFKKANPDQKGAHLVFLANYKKEHDEEWKAFQAEWKEAHPKDKDDSVSDAGSASGSATGSATMSATGSEKKRVLTPEHLAKMKAGREAAKAAKATEAAKATDTFVATTSVSSAAIPAPMAAPMPKSKPVKKVKAKEPIVEPVAVSSNASVEDDAPEELPFKHGGVTYIRLGNKREDGTYLWATGDLWANKKGARGAYVGAIQDDGSVDTDALEPLLE